MTDQPLWTDVSYRTVEAWMLFGGIGGCPDCGVRAEFTADEKNRIDAWLILLEAKIRADERAKIATDIEAHYLGPDSGRSFDGNEAPDADLRNAYDEGLERAARIARERR